MEKKTLDKIIEILLVIYVLVTIFFMCDFLPVWIEFNDAKKYYIDNCMYTEDRTNEADSTIPLRISSW